MFQITGDFQDHEHVSVILKIWQAKDSRVSIKPAEKKKLHEALETVLAEYISKENSNKKGLPTNRFIVAM